MYKISPVFLLYSEINGINTIETASLSGNKCAHVLHVLCYFLLISIIFLTVILASLVLVIVYTVALVD